MPLIRIEIIKGKDAGYKKELLVAVHTALVNAIQIENWDRFQRLYEIEEEFFERSESKTDKFTMIEITMFQGRTKEQKTQIYEEIVKELEQSEDSNTYVVSGNHQMLTDGDMAAQNNESSEKESSFVPIRFAETV